MHLAAAVGAPTVGVFFSGDSARWGHQLPSFAAAEVRTPADHAIVLEACDRLLAR
jgi:ADP-heptose:LPS heptosyltransferase